MSKRGTILVGTVGQGVFRSVDGGETWGRAGVDQGMHSDCLVRCLVPHPRQPAVIYAGTDLGLYRTDDAGAHWRLLDTLMNGQVVWSVALDEADPQRIIAGTGTPTPPAVYQSSDGGATWQAGAAEFAAHCPAVGVPRPTAIAIDPTDRANVWMGVEVDGMRRSQDGGKSWARACPAIKNPDVHNVLVTNGPTRRILVLVNNDVWLSDDGEDWQPVGVRERFAWHYPRGVAMRPDDPNVLFVTLGDATPGRTGGVMRSRDAGRTWESVELSAPPNSAMWTISVSRQDPDVVLTGSRYGYLYRSDDGGSTFTRSWREFSEISSLAWVPD